MTALHPRIHLALAEQWARKVVTRVELAIPIPPSVNELYRNVSATERARAKAAGRKLPGRVKTERYRTWMRGAEATIAPQRPGMVKGEYTLVLLVPRSQSKADIGNLEKGVSDLMQSAGIVENDRKAEFVISGWMDSEKDEAIVIITAGTRLPSDNNDPTLRRLWLGRQAA